MAMEVEVLGVTGAPEGSIVSVRVGGQRRQAAANSIGQSKTPFRFAAGPNGLNPFRVDLLKPVGSAKLALKPGEGSYTTTLHGPGGRDVQVKFAVCEPGKAPPAMDPDEAEAQAEEETKIPPLSLDALKGADGQLPLSAAVAKEYLDQHNLLPFVRSLLQTVIRERPEDPFSYIEEQFRNAAGAAANVKNSNNCNLIDVKRAHTSAPKPAVGMSFDQIDVNNDGVIDREEYEAAQAKAEPKRKPVPPKRPPPKKNPDPDFNPTLVHKPSVGTWLLKKSKERYVGPHITPKFRRGQTAIDTEHGPQKPLRPFIELQTVASPAKTTSGQQLDAAELRKRAQDMLLTASVDGSLEKVLVDEAPASGTFDAAELRRRAQEALLKASLDGSLDASLSETTTQGISADDLEVAREKGKNALTALFEAEELKDKAVEALEAAMETEESKQRAVAALESSLLGDEASDLIEDAKASARNALKAAFKGGSEDGSDSGVETAKARARSALEGALNSSESDLSQQDLDTAKTNARNALMHVLEDDKVVSGTPAFAYLPAEAWATMHGRFPEKSGPSTQAPPPIQDKPMQEEPGGEVLKAEKPAEEPADEELKAAALVKAKLHQQRDEIAKSNAKVKEELEAAKRTFDKLLAMKGLPT